MLRPETISSVRSLRQSLRQTATPFTARRSADDDTLLPDSSSRNVSNISKISTRRGQPAPSRLSCCGQTPGLPFLDAQSAIYTLFAFRHSPRDPVQPFSPLKHAFRLPIFLLPLPSTSMASPYAALNTSFVRILASVLIRRPVSALYSPIPREASSLAITRTPAHTIACPTPIVSTAPASIRARRKWGRRGTPSNDDRRSDHTWNARSAPNARLACSASAPRVFIVIVIVIEGSRPPPALGAAAVGLMAVVNNFRAFFASSLLFFRSCGLSRPCKSLSAGTALFVLWSRARGCNVHELACDRPAAGSRSLIPSVARLAFVPAPARRSDAKRRTASLIL